MKLFALATALGLSVMSAPMTQPVTEKAVYQYETNELVSVDDLVVGNAYRLQLVNDNDLIYYGIYNDASYNGSYSLFGDFLSIYNNGDFTISVSVDNYHTIDITHDIGSILTFNVENGYLVNFNISTLLLGNDNDGYTRLTYSIWNTYNTFYYDFVYNGNNYSDYDFASAIISRGFLTACPTTYYYIGDYIPPTTLFDQIVDFFESNVFNSEQLNTYTFTFFGTTETMGHYLSITSSIISIVAIVIMCIAMVIFLMKIIGALFYNFGR